MTLGDRLVEHIKKLEELNALPRPLYAFQSGSVEYHQDGIRILGPLAVDGWTDGALA